LREAVMVDVGADMLR